MRRPCWLSARMGSCIWKVAPLTQRRFNPDATTVHLDDLLGDGEAEAGPALGLGVGVVDLVELLEDAVQLLRRYPWTRVGHGNGEVAVHGRRGDAHFASVGELDGVADEVEEHLGEALLVAQADRQLLGNVGLERELLGLRQRLGCRAHRLDHALDGVLAEVQAELAGLDLGDVEHGVDQAQQVLAVGADAREGIHRFLGQRLVEAFLHQLGIAEDGGERGSQLVAHVGDELRLVLAGDLQARGSSGRSPRTGGRSRARSRTGRRRSA